MKLRCPDLNCSSHQNRSLKTRLFVRNGTYYRRSDSRFIRRFICLSCNRSFSQETFKSTYRQKKRRISHPLKLLLNSGVSQRRAAMILGVNPKTVVRRFRFLAAEERLNQEAWLKSTYQNSKLSFIQFDDFETVEHTKCKPVSVSLAIDPETRKILKFYVSRMPAKGLIAKTSLQKYGYRKDERPKAWDQLMRSLIPIVEKKVHFLSDENPHYPKYVFKHHPDATHETTKGGRGSLSGQGELKKLKFDPLFSLNHTCAMFRANLNRFFRRTWCVSKTIQGIEDHLSLYVTFHNQTLTPEVPTRKGGS